MCVWEVGGPLARFAGPHDASLCVFMCCACAVWVRPCPADIVDKMSTRLTMFRDRDGTRRSGGVSDTLSEDSVVPVPQRMYGVNLLAAKQGEVFEGEYELAVQESWLTQWSSAFFNPSRLTTTSPSTFQALQVCVDVLKAAYVRAGGFGRR